jgi:hypothetical protein
MGYTKTVQYGDIVEYYEYDKNLHRNQKPKKRSKMAIKRSKAIRELPNYTPPSRSVKRAKTNFFRLVHHNNVCADSVTFLTLTFSYDSDFRHYGRVLASFIRDINKHYASETRKKITYIGVPELTKKGRYHFHLLVYNLPPYVSKIERDTRNLQRLYKAGYLDARLATIISPKIAGYMAKYMAKHFSASGNTHKRAYTCSRGIEKITSYGSNENFYDTTQIEKSKIDKNIYDVPYMGTCTKSIYKIPLDDTI